MACTWRERCSWLPRSNSQQLFVELKTVFMFTCVRGTCVVEHLVGDWCSRFKPLSSLHPSVLSLSHSLFQLSGGIDPRRSSVPHTGSSCCAELLSRLGGSWPLLTFCFRTQPLLEAPPPLLPSQQESGGVSRLLIFLSACFSLLPPPSAGPLRPSAAGSRSRKGGEELQQPESLPGTADTRPLLLAADGFRLASHDIFSG